MRIIMILAAILVVLGTSMAKVADNMSTERAQAKAIDKARAMNAFASMQPQTSGSASGRSVTVARDSRGHFQTEGRVDGRRLGFMVDTGASVIALTEREAERLGIRPSGAAYTASVSTANGVVRAAPVTLNSVDIGGLVVRDVRALVVPGRGLSENLLGLSYLTRLKRFEYSNNRLLLEN